MTKLVAAVDIGTVGGIGAVVLSRLHQKGFHLLPGAVPQGTDDSVPHIRNAPQAANPGASGKVEKHCFHGVIQGMGGSDDSILPCPLMEKFIAPQAGIFLQAHPSLFRLSFGVEGATDKLHPQLLSQTADKLLIAVAFLPPQAVVHMTHL